MTIVSAMGQIFYSLSIAMGILITFGSYMKKEVSIKGSKENVEIFDTAILIMAGLMIILAVFSFSGGDMEILKAGPSLMFITIPKVFASMRLGTGIGIIFFLLVLFAAITSFIVLTESAVSTFQDELHWYRKKIYNHFRHYYDWVRNTIMFRLWSIVKRNNHRNAIFRLL